MNGEELARPTGVGTAILAEEEPILPEPSEEFVETAHVQQLTERALAYLDVGYAVHFAGPAGTGKTTLAFHVAAQRARPVILIHGDDEFASSDLVGRDTGYRKQKLVDNFIHSVLKTEETMSTLWVDNRLTTACQQGHTLIYDEFNRSRPEANNALLSVLEEKILNLPKLRRSGESYLQVHPGFRAIFTSNPEEYAGIHKMQDALMDRLVTIHTDHFDRDTEVDCHGEIGYSPAGSSQDRGYRAGTPQRRGEQPPTYHPSLHCDRANAGPLPRARATERSRLPVGVPGRAQCGHGKSHSQRSIAHAANGGQGDPQSVWQRKTSGERQSKSSENEGVRRGDSQKRVARNPYPLWQAGSGPSSLPSLHASHLPGDGESEAGERAEIGPATDRQLGRSAQGNRSRKGSPVGGPRGAQRRKRGQVHWRSQFGTQALATARRRWVQAPVLKGRGPMLTRKSSAEPSNQRNA